MTLGGVYSEEMAHGARLSHGAAVSWGGVLSIIQGEDL